MKATVAEKLNSETALDESATENSCTEVDAAESEIMGKLRNCTTEREFICSISESSIAAPEAGRIQRSRNEKTFCQRHKDC